MALKRMPQSRYWIAQFMVGGRTVTRSTRETDKRKARAKCEEIKRQARLLYGRPSVARKLSEARVAEVARLETDVSHWQAERVEAGLWNFEKWIGDVSLDRIVPKLLEDYQRHRLKAASKGTVGKELCYIVRMLKNNGCVVEKPKAKPGRVTELRPLSKEELQRFFEHCPEELKPLFLLMLCTGARPAELIPSQRSNHVPLLKSEIDSERCVVTIRSAKVLPGGRGAVRRVGIPAELTSQIKAQAGRHELDTVFPPFGHLCHRFDRILKRAEIEKRDALGRKLAAHSFRHTFATMMAEAVGHNPFVVKQLLGHSQIATTDRYCHPTAQAQVIDLGEILGLIRVSGRVSSGLESEITGV